jgi:glucose/mannose-6-phosphate isomerase
MSPLDDPSTYALDSEKMLRHIRETGVELVRAWDASDKLELPVGALKARGVVVAGMGGSATGGDYFSALCMAGAHIPVVVIRGYELPGWVDEATLVVVASHSGNTEEALACYEDGRRRGSKLFALTTGGRLAELVRRDRTCWHQLTYDAPPRAALAHNLAPLLRMGSILGFCATDRSAVYRAGELHTSLSAMHIGELVPTTENRAKQIAMGIAGRFVIVFGAEHLTSVARRFRNQLSENGKTLGSFEMLPEANHNFVVGLGTAPGISGSLAAVMLESTLYDSRLRQRFDVTASLLREAEVPVFRIEVGGETPLEQLLQGTAWGDYVSTYVALLQGLDPTPIPQIDRIKDALLAAVQSGRIERPSHCC